MSTKVGLTLNTTELDKIVDSLAFSKKKDWEKSHKDIRIMLLTIGFARSGSSLLGYLLTAHPNIVIADEAPSFVSKMRICISDKTNLETVFNLILEHDFRTPLKSYIPNSAIENYKRS